MKEPLNNAMITAILQRRSLRAYKPDQVPESALAAILSCGLSAPSGMNRQPWHISVVNDQSLIEEMHQAILTEVRRDPAYAAILTEGFHVFHRAPLVLVVSVKTDDIWGEVDGGLLAGNMFLAANSLGLGACVIGFMRFLFTGSQADIYLRRLRVPAGNKVLFGLTLGYPADDAEVKPPYQLSLTEAQQGKITYL